MRRFYSLRNILLSIFFFSFFIPITAIIIIIPSSYKKQYLEETNLLINSNLDIFSENLNSYLLELQQLATFPVFKKNVLDQLLDKKKQFTLDNTDIDTLFLSTIPDYLRISRKDILSILIHFDNITVFSNRNKNISLMENYDFSGQDWYRETLEGGDKINYIGSHKPEYFTNSDTISVFSVAKTISHPYRDDLSGVIIADADTTVFEEMLKNFKSSISSVTILLDENSKILYSSTDIDREILENLKNNKNYIIMNREIFRANYSVLSPSKWKIVILLSQTEINNKIRWIYIIVICISVAGFFISLILFQFLTRIFIANPISRMMLVMKEVEKGNLRARFTTDSNKELNSLGISLNEMILQLNNHIDKEYRLVLQQKNAEYRALQAQIQPHFIYNTLNGFLALNRLGQKDILEKSIFNLTGMLRYTLAVDEDTTIENEFDFIEKYCALQKLRFQERLVYEINYENIIKDIKIPRLIIQPLIENAVKHGVEPLTKECSVILKGEKIFYDGSFFIRITVKDNGAGFDKSLFKDRNIGINNIEERLSIFSFKSTFKIETSLGKGTSVEITLPMENE